MSRKKPVRIAIEKEISVLPEDIYEAVVCKSGNGAAVKAFKKDIGKACIVIIKQK